MSAKAVTGLCTHETVRVEPHVTPGLLEKIAHSVIDGYIASLHGGLEVGGVLFGRRESVQVTAEKFRPLACDHSLGPRFMLSENDERGLRDLLEAPRVDPSLEGLEVVGWYCSHTRSELVLLDYELLLHRTHFPGQHEFVLVFRPRDLRSVTVGIFSRNSDGTIDPNHPSNVLELPELRTIPKDNQIVVNNECDPSGDCSRPFRRNLKEHISRLPHLLSALNHAAPHQLARESEALAHSRRLDRKKRAWSLASKVVVITAAIMLAVLGAWKWVQLVRPHAAEVALSVRPYAGDFLVLWKSNLAKANRARVDIVDGSSSEHLNVTDIFQQSGVLMLPRTSGNIQATLTVDTTNGAIVRHAGFNDSFDPVRSIVVGNKSVRSEEFTSSSPVANQQIATSSPIPTHVQPPHARHKRHAKRRRF